MRETFAIVCDSAGNLPLKFYETHQVEVVPCSVQVGKETFVDSVEQLSADFYEAISAYSSKVSVVHPSSNDFEEMYKKLIEEGYTAILSLHASSEFVDSYASAISARKNIQDNIRIEVINTKSISLGLGVLIADVVALRKSGASLDNVLQHIVAVQSKIKTYVVSSASRTPLFKKSLQQKSLSRLKSALFGAKRSVVLEQIDNNSLLSSVLVAVDLSDAAGKLARMMSKDAHISGEVLYCACYAGDEKSVRLLEKPLDTNEFDSVCAGTTAMNPLFGAYFGNQAVGISYVSKKDLFDFDFVAHSVW